MKQLETINAMFKDALMPLGNGEIFDINTLQTSSELMSEMSTKSDIILNRRYFTSDFGMYNIENGEAFLYLAGRETNPILNNFEDFCRQITRNLNYIVNENHKQAVIESSKNGLALKVKLSGLRLNNHNSYSAYLKITTSDYNDVSEPERLLAQWVYGGSEVFSDNMEILNRRGIGHAYIYLLSEDYIQGLGQDNAIARISYLCTDSNMAIFASHSADSFGEGALRGICISSCNSADDT